MCVSVGQMEIAKWHDTVITLMFLYEISMCRRFLEENCLYLYVSASMCW